MSTNRKQWLLKVIAGPNKGAEIELRSGKMLIGSDDECDVILHDVLIAPQHVEIETAANGVTAAPLGGRVYVNGKRIRDAMQAVPEFAFISIGGSHVAIGLDGVRWPLLSAADIPELEKEGEDQSADEKRAEAPVVVDPAPLMAAPGATPGKKPKSARIIPLAGIIAGFMILLGWFVAYENYSGSSKGESTGQGVSSNQLDRARAVVDEMGLKDTIKVDEVAGRISISGYVNTEAEQRGLQVAFREKLPGVNTRVYSLEKIASTARSLIDDQHMTLTVSSVGEGKLKITGRLPSTDSWARIKQGLERSVPGIAGIEDDIEIESPLALAPSLRTPETKASQQGALTPSGTPIQTAKMADPETGHLITSDTIDTPESTVAVIKGGAGMLGFVRLNTGGVYFTGARLPFGGTVITIDEYTLTIEEKGGMRTLRKGDRVVIPRGEKVSTSSNSTRP